MSIEGTVSVQPTSSTRTLLSETTPRVYIKTDLDKKHFRFIRRLKRSSVEHSVSISNDLHQFSKLLTDDFRYAFLPESVGIIIQGGAHHDSGVIFRESKPYPEVFKNNIIIPFHALYAKDPFNLRDSPLLVQLIELNGKSDPLGYFVNEVVDLILRAWTVLVSKRGLLPEIHGQNAMIEIDQNFQIGRLVHRDFQSMYHDIEIRKKLGLGGFVKHEVGKESGTTYESQYSIVFDNMIGKYLLTRICKLFSETYDIKYEDVANCVKNHHHKLPGFEASKFPNTTYCFSSSSREQNSNEVVLVDSGYKPEFR